MKMSEPKSDEPTDVELSNATPAEIRKRMWLIGAMLGLMLCAALVVILKAIVKRDVSLVVVPLPMFLIAIPMWITLVRLRRRLSGAGPQV